jgi:hypothetical protein
MKISKQLFLQGLQLLNNLNIDMDEVCTIEFDIDNEIISIYDEEDNLLKEEDF